MGLRHQLSFVAISLVFSGCAVQQEGAVFERPDVTVNNTVSLATATTSQSVDAVQSVLKAAGFAVTHADRNVGIVQAQKSTTDYIDCGQITQVALGNSATFAGNAPRSVIYRSGSVVDFQIREVSSNTRVQVNIDQDKATVVDRSDVKIRWSSSDRKKTSSEKQIVTTGAATRFRDNIICTGNGGVTDLLR